MKTIDERIEDVLYTDIWASSADGFGAVEGRHEATEKLIKIAKLYGLNEQHRILSELEEQFPKGSKHKAAIFIDKKMREIYNKIKEIESAGDQKQ
jgi:hypothetical protein